MFSPNNYTKSVRDRMVKYRFPVEEINETTTKVVDLNVFHHMGRGFTASVNPVTVEKKDGYSTEKFAMFSGARIGSQAVARYNAKKMDAFAEEMLAQFQREYTHPAYMEIIGAPAEV